MPTKQGYQRQHIIPFSLRKSPIFVKAGMDINAAGNMMYLPVCEGIDDIKRGYHRGWTKEHENYNIMVNNKLGDLQRQSIRENWDKVRTQKELSALQLKLRASLNTGALTCASAKIPAKKKRS
ncbi:AHH domain-containing protein [Acinetobacter gerneri]|uniref:AHH domain-containing protein n=1 Tax=Acinetobacter gerneri TaxID=202952 RepID=A0AAW8JN59_9GAMM|nr:AHH domain-containing protein [Acinetobacter gerneri]MDQ9011140.1 AHH domain-containing protein [Acinetobacter gerneri]MDQ9015276.1 AHH domain-containing protein [Acinetobacter gerneri]MDQ9026447.1 AHH domain-containing protein [Acinetobacter gerneri]MDQ9053728.1 AHH domain-containing protein [Acinetobacter gerneri]MDQ9061331.1 AHH domain-containing protein [Acinetobacter gerneri]